MDKTHTDAVIVAGGSGSRMGLGTDKLLIPLCGKSVLWYTIQAFEAASCIDEIVLVVSGGNKEPIENLVKRSGFSKVSAIVLGGGTRQESVYNGLTAVSYDADYVAIHDGARAMVTADIIEKTIEGAKRYGGAAAAVSVKDTLKAVNEQGLIDHTIDRSRVFHVQTPQTFRKTDIVKCHQQARKEGFSATDDCALFEHYGLPVMLTQGSYDNIKITTKEDIPAAEHLLACRGQKG